MPQPFGLPWEAPVHHEFSERLLGDDVGEEPVLEVGDLVLEDELALLQALNAELIGPGVPDQPVDDVIQVTVLRAQVLELSFQ